MRFKQCAVVEFLVAEKESVRIFQKCFWIVYGCAVAVVRSTVGRWVQKVTATELHDLLRSGRPVVAVRPKCRRAMMPSLGRMDALQLDSWRSFFQSAKEVPVALFEAFNIWICVWDGSRNLTGETKPREEQSHVAASFWMWGRDVIIPDC